MKKGFTLIELLAVIVILAIILLIAMPIVLNVISNAKKGAFESTAYGLSKTAENECLTEALSNSNRERIVLFSDGDFDSESDGDLKFSGKGPDDGYIKINESCTIEMAIRRDLWCALKEANSTIITIIDLEEGQNCDFTLLEEGEETLGYPMLVDVGHEGYEFTPLTNPQIHDLIDNDGWIPIATKAELKQIEGIMSWSAPVSLTFGAGTEFEMVHSVAEWDDGFLYYAGGMWLNYILVADIDLNGAFEPIGYSEMGPYGVQTFNGNFDGNGHRIYNGVINYPTEVQIGLFAKVSATSESTFPFDTEDRYIKNVTMENMQVMGKDAVGILIGHNEAYAMERGTTIINCHVSGTVTGNGSGIGGLLGLGDQVGVYSILHSSSAANVTNLAEADEVYGHEMLGGLRPGGWTGGLAGRSSIVTNSSASGNVTGASVAGGLVGIAYGTVSKSYATGDVTGIDDEDFSLGGLIGTASEVASSYATGNVTGKEMIGGLVGHAWDTINNSYASGIITGTDSVGGLVGLGLWINNSYNYSQIVGTPTNVGGLIGKFDDWDTPLVTNSYYNSQTTNQSDSDGRGLPRTTSQLVYPHDVDTYVSWNFTSIWKW